MKKYFIAITKTIRQDFDFPVYAETPEEAKKIAQEMIDKGVLGTSYYEETEVKIDMIRDEMCKKMDIKEMCKKITAKNRPKEKDFC